MLLVKTHKDTLANVIAHCKHAFDAQPNLTLGEIILIAQTKETLSPGQEPIRFRMEFYRIYPDENDESKKIWGKPWRYILEGRNCHPLKNPFDISEVQVSNNNYKQGGPFMHVAQEDVNYLYEAGYLETL